MDTFKDNVTEYCKANDKIKEVQLEIKELKTQEKNLHDVILEFMCTNNLEVCNAGEMGLITVQTSMSKSSLKQENIKEGLMKILNENPIDSSNIEDVAENGADYIYNNREVEEKKKLKRKILKK